LLADDDPDDVLLLQRALRRAPVGVSLQIVRDGEQAVQYLNGQGPYRDRRHFPMPRLLLLDWKLPRRSGLEVLSWIRARQALDPLPVVILSSSGELEDRQQAFAARANSYLQKPAGSQALQSLVDALLAYWLVYNHAPALEP
jgi:CheY-like chemotaxis protein